MTGKMELCPIELGPNRFWEVICSLYAGSYLILVVFGDFIQDSILRLCVLGWIQNILTIILLLWFCRLKNWPTINSLKMHLWNMIFKGIIGELQLFLITDIVWILWQRVIMLLSNFFYIEIKEQALIELLRMESVNKEKVLGVIFLVAILAPIAEEIFFRYFLYRFWKSCMSSGKAALLTSLIFAALHFNLAAFAPLFAMGIFLIFLYERCCNLIPCIIVHSLYNYISVLLVLLSEKF